MPIKQLSETDQNKPMSPFPAKKPEMEKIKCDCGCTFFEELKVQQFPRLHNLVVGQELPPIDGVDFYVIRCVNCNGIIAPQVMYGQQDVRSKRYEEFITEMTRLQEEAKPVGDDGEVV